MFGLLNINKPVGKTSRDVVNHVQRLVRPAKVGHAGTLDPLATGVLVVCVGPATRLIQYVQQQPKRYTATFLLGRKSESDDVEGEVFELDDPPRPALQDIQQALPQFTGTIHQRPPAFSAIKVEGKRAYKLAREGQNVALDARPVTIHGIEVMRYEYPQLVVDVRCGSGTYIRSIGRDLAETLGTAAVMSALARTEIGPFSAERAVNLEQISADTLAEFFLPPGLAVAHLPSISVDEIQFQLLGRGVMLTGIDCSGEEIAAFDSSDRLIGILAPHRRNQHRPLINFAPAILAERNS